MAYENIIWKCARCGDEFHPKSMRQKCCNKDIQVPCAVCGKLMHQICTFANQSKTCSKECADKLIKQTREASAAKLIKVCKYCGKEFTPKFVREEYCAGPHFAKCEVCGNEYEITDVTRTDIRRTCSDECRWKLMTQHTDYTSAQEAQIKTLQERYGVTNGALVPGAQEKAKSTSLERYGKEWYTQTAEYISRIKATDTEKYGYEHHLMAPEVIAKREAHNEAKYGVKNVFQIDSVKDKTKQTLNSKYGVDYITQSQEIREKILYTNQTKYGVRHPMMLDEYKAKAINTTQAKYGRHAYTQQHITDIDKWYKFIQDPRSYVTHNFDESPTTKELAEYFGVDRSTIDVYLSKEDAYDCVSRLKSIMESEICEFIHQLDPTIEIIQNTRSIIAPLELDIYLPQYSIAIECNPTVTHNSSFIDPWGGKPKSYKYHQIKSERCRDNNVFLFHIFGYEWTWDEPIILSMIANLLHHSTQRIYARKCKVVEVSATVARKFLNEHHRQHYTNASVRLGLVHEGELVSMMTFGKMRNTIGSGSEDLSQCWELSRFCSCQCTNVVGGASKLFKYFVDHYEPVQIRSFSDCAHVKGNLYETLSFKFIRQADATYTWVDLHTDKGYHRMSGRKSNLKQFLKDDSIDLTLTEKEIMEAHGFAQVFDSGTVTWEWRNNS